jgi:hypothetical protein
MSASASALQDLKKQQSNSRLLDDAEASLAFAERYDKYVKAGGKPEEEGLDSAATAVFAWTLAAKAFERLDEELYVLVSPSPRARSRLPILAMNSNVIESGEVEASTPSPVLDIAGSSRFSVSLLFLLLIFSSSDAIITDPRGFHIPAGKSDKLPLSEKLRLQLACDAKILDVEQFIQTNVVPKDVVEYYNGKVKEEGWQK